MPTPAPQHDQLTAAAAASPTFTPGDLAWCVNALHRHAWTPVVVVQPTRDDVLCRTLHGGALRRFIAYPGCVAPLDAAPEQTWTPEQRDAVQALKLALSSAPHAHSDSSALRAQADADLHAAAAADQEADETIEAGGLALGDLTRADLRIYALRDLAHHLRGVAQARRELASVLDGHGRTDRRWP